MTAAEPYAGLNAALERTRPHDDLAAQIAHRLTCTRCRMGWTCGGVDESDITHGRRIADLLDQVKRAALAPIRDFHDRWGSADVDELDQLALWEDLARLLRAGDADV